MKDVEQTKPKDRTVSVRLVYEVIQQNAGEGESPVASLETVKHDFAFDGQKWVASP